jgi:TonB family protein
MFGNMVESSSHKADYARKSWFFFGTLTVYALVFLAIGVGSIYAYNTHIDNQNLELVALITPVETAQVQPQPRSAAPRSTAGGTNQRAMSVRTAIVAPTTDTTKVPVGTSSEREDVPPVTAGLPAVIGKANMDVGGGNGRPGAGKVFGDDSSPGGNGKGVGELVRDTPPPPMKKQTVKLRTTTISLGVINGKATHLPKPMFTAIAKAAQASGIVTVQVLIDESGKVISAQAVSGHPLLQRESVQAAYQARFSPTLLSNQPVKVSGIITYNFVRQ